MLGLLGIRAGTPTVTSVATKNGPWDLMSLLEVLDRPFASKFGLKFDELVPFLPTFPLPISTVFDSWPTKMKQQLPLKQFKRLAKTHYSILCTQNNATTGEFCVMVQPHLSGLNGFGKSDRDFIKYAELELAKLQKVSRAIGADFTPISMVCNLTEMTVDELFSCSDALTFSEDLSCVRLRWELAQVDCFRNADQDEHIDVNATLSVIANSVPTRFVHVADLQFPKDFVRSFLFRKEVSHSIEWDFPYVRLRDAFEHPCKGSAVLPSDARTRSTAAKGVEYSCHHLPFFNLAPEAHAPLNIFESLPNEDMERLLSTVEDGSALGFHVLKGAPNLPGVLVLCNPKSKWVLVESLWSVKQHECLTKLLSNPSVAKLTLGFTIQRGDNLLRKYQFSVQGWVNTPQLALFAGYPILPGRSVSASMLLRDLGGVSRSDILRFEEAKSINWSSVALSATHREFVSSFLFPLDCGAASLWSRGVGTVEALKDGRLSTNQVIAINSIIRSWAADQVPPGVQIVPSPCSQLQAAKFVCQLRCALKHTAVEHCYFAGKSNPVQVTSVPLSISMTSNNGSAVGTRPGCTSPEQSNLVCSPPNDSADDPAPDDIAAALAEAAMFEAPAARDGPLMHDMLARRLNSIKQTIPTPNDRESVAPTPKHQAPPPVSEPQRDDASFLAEITLPTEYVTPHVSEIPPPAKPTMHLPPSTRHFAKLPKKTAPVQPAATPTATKNDADGAHQPSWSTLNAIPEDVRRKIAEDWLKEQIKQQALE